MKIKAKQRRTLLRANLCVALVHIGSKTVIEGLVNLQSFLGNKGHNDLLKKVSLTKFQTQIIRIRKPLCHLFCFGTCVPSACMSACVHLDYDVVIL